MAKLRISAVKRKLIKKLNSVLKPGLIILIILGCWNLSFYYTQVFAQFFYMLSGIILACMVMAKSGSKSEQKLLDFYPVAVYFKYLTLVFMGLCLFGQIGLATNFKFFGIGDNMRVNYLFKVMFRNSRVAWLYAFYLLNCLYVQMIHIEWYIVKIKEEGISKEDIFQGLAGQIAEKTKKGNEFEIPEHS